MRSRPACVGVHIYCTLIIASNKALLNNFSECEQRKDAVLGKKRASSTQGAHFIRGPKSQRRVK